MCVHIIHTHTYTYTHVYIFIYIYIYIYIFIWKTTHTHAHTHMYGKPHIFISKPHVCVCARVRAHTCVLYYQLISTPLQFFS